jgi:hypothetical protein
MACVSLASCSGSDEPSDAGPSAPTSTPGSSYRGPDASAAVGAHSGPAPTPHGPQLHAVSATGPADVWAVGERRTVSPLRTTSIVLHFDGSTWILSPAPDVHLLIDVAAIARTDVWAIGQEERTAVIHWDGSTWSQVKLPKVAGMGLSAVAGSAPDDVWIVGTRDGARLPHNSIGNHTLAFHWDGDDWSIVPTPNPNHAYNRLDAVVALSPTDAWAVGGVRRRGITMHWDGTRWRLVPTPLLRGHPVGWLPGLGTDGRDGIWAVGQGRGIGYGESVYLHWTGQAWQTVAGRPNDGRATTPSAVSGSSPHNLWAVGSEAGDRYMLARYEHGRWRTLRARLPRGVERWRANLADVVTISPDDAWAVGVANVSTGTGDNPATKSLLLHWDGTAWRSQTAPGGRVLVGKCVDTVDGTSTCTDHG